MADKKSHTWNACETCSALGRWDCRGTALRRRGCVHYGETDPCLGGRWDRCIDNRLSRRDLPADWLRPGLHKFSMSLPILARASSAGCQLTDVCASEGSNRKYCSPLLGTCEGSLMGTNTFASHFSRGGGWRNVGLENIKAIGLWLYRT